MHVGCDAAECHHHILGYLKIDLAAFVCVCAHRYAARGPVGCLSPAFILRSHFYYYYFFLLFRRASCSHAVLQYKKWS